MDIEKLFKTPMPFTKASKKTLVSIYFLNTTSFKKWLKKQTKTLPKSN